MRIAPVVVATVWVSLVIGCLSGCSGAGETGGSREPEPIVETIEVGGGIDQDLSTTEDRVGPRWVETEEAVSENNWPEGFPSIEGASAVEFGSQEDGWRVLELVADSGEHSDVAEVERRLLADLKRAGWTAEVVAPGRISASRTGLQAVISLTRRATTGTHIRVRYR